MAEDKDAQDEKTVNGVDSASENGTGETASISPDSVESMKAELDKAKTDYLYLQAEFDNFRKQAIRERSQLMKFGAERFIRDFLEIVDNMERASQGQINEQNIEQFRVGMQLTAKEMQSLLGRHGVVEIESEKQDFNPELHEALGSEESGELSPGKILRVLRKGYKYHDKLLRPGQVVVAKPPSSPANENPTE